MPGKQEIRDLGAKLSMGIQFPDQKPPLGTSLAPLPSLANVKSFAFDTETTAEQFLFDRTLTGLSYHLPDGRKGYVSMRHPGGGNYNEANVSEWMRREFRGKELVVFNAKHEHHTVKKWGVDFEELGVRFNDVAHQAPLIDEKRRKTNLELLAQEELDHKMIEIDHASFWRMPAEQVAPAAIEDAEITWRLCEKLMPRIKKDDLEEVLRLENDIVFSTCEMERNGSHLDIPLLIQWDGELKHEIESRQLQIFQETGLRINVNSGDDLSKLFRYLGIVNDFKTEGGDESFGEDVLLEFTNHHPLIRTIIETRQMSSLHSKYISKYLDSAKPDGRVFYALHQLRGDEGGTITGRYSSAAMFKGKGGGINIQQVVKTKKMPPAIKRWPIRKAFIAPEGESFLSSDASQIEYRLFTHYASLCRSRRTGEYMTRLAEVYRNNPKTDFHNTVHQWTGLQERDHTKNVNFCKLYGGGEEKIMLTINLVNRVQGRSLITPREVHDLVQQYDREFPEANELMRMAEDLAKRRSYVRTMSGRRRRYNINDPYERFYSALNAIFQGGAADVAKKKILRLYRERKVLGLTLRSQVHDEINGSIMDPLKKPLIEEVMAVQEYPLNVPILWETGVGANWDEAH